MKITGDLHEHIDDWNQHQLFTYVILTIIILWIFSGRDFGINVLVGIIIVIFCISYLSTKQIKESKLSTETKQHKIENINPKLNELSIENSELLNIIYDIQYLQDYNQLQHKLIIKNINSFHIFYEICKKENKYASKLYYIMLKNKRNALNALSSIILSTETIDEKNKIEKIINDLDSILSIELDRVSYMVENHIFKNGYDSQTKILIYDMYPSNEYEDIDKLYSYELY
jgi:hypothetical protein